MGIKPDAWKRVQVEEMRGWCATQADATSIRFLATAADVRHSTLHNFIHGSMPHPRTRMKLAKYYLLNARGQLKSVDDAMDVMLAGIPERQMEGARQALLNAVVEVYRLADVKPPAWMEERAGD
jgi:hypothetical protein